MVQLAPSEVMLVAPSEVVLWCLVAVRERYQCVVDVQLIGVVARAPKVGYAVAASLLARRQVRWPPAVENLVAMVGDKWAPSDLAWWVEQSVVVLPGLAAGKLGWNN